MKDRLAAAVADVLGLPPGEIRETTGMENCSQWDSLRHYLLILAVESSFGVRFSSEDIPSLTRVGLLRAKLTELAGGDDRAR